MTTTLPGAPGDPTQWLRLIDGDHAVAPTTAHPCSPRAATTAATATCRCSRAACCATWASARSSTTGRTTTRPASATTTACSTRPRTSPTSTTAMSFDPERPAAATCPTLVVRHAEGRSSPARHMGHAGDADDDQRQRRLLASRTRSRPRSAIDGTPTTSVRSAGGRRSRSASHADGLATIAPSAERSVPHQPGVVTSNGLTVDNTPPDRHHHGAGGRPAAVRHRRLRSGRLHRRRRCRGRRRRQHVRGAARRRPRCLTSS